MQTSKSNLLLARLVIAVAILLSAPLTAQACSASGQNVARPMNAKIAIYSASGEYLKDIDGALIATNRPILACDDATTHVKVGLTDGAAVWVDRLDVEITGGATTPHACKDKSIAKPDDQTTPATSGIDPCSR